MAFCLNPDLKHIGSYGEALTRYHDTAPWPRNYAAQYKPRDARPLDRSKRKYHMSMSKGDQEEIKLTYHSTDVVTYFPDGSIKIVAYTSVSTSMFAACVTPPGVSVQATSGLGFLVWLNGGDRYWSDYGKETRHGYVVNDRCTLTKDEDGLWAIDGSELIETYHLIKKEANKARKNHHYADWLAYANGYRRMFKRWSPDHAPDKKFGTYIGYERMAPEGIAQCLKSKDPEEWAKLLSLGNGAVLQGLYKHVGCVEIGELPFITSWTQIKNIKSQQEKYSWARWRR